MSRPASAQESACTALRALYRSFGYLPFKVNKFEEYDLYAQNKSFLACQQVLTFSNTDGRLMALKPDVTLSIVRSSTGRERVRKVYYTENVYRDPGDGEGFREIPQTGLECLGELDSYALGEAVMLAKRSLEVISEKSVLDVSHIGLVSGVLDAAAVPTADRPRLWAAVAARSAPELRAMGLPQATETLLLSLAALYGPLEDTLTRLRALPLPPGCATAIAELEALSRVLGLFGIQGVMLDPSVVSDPAYYSALVFRGFAEGAAAPVLSGGQYDPLLRKLGKAGGAIGFAVYLETLERLCSAPRGFDADALILYGGEDDLPAAIGTAQAHVRSGESVLVSRFPPEGLRFRRTLRVENGEVRQ